MNDILVWIIGIIFSYLNYKKDVNIIHMNYQLNHKVKRIMFIHHIIMTFLLFGVLFSSSINIKLHALFFSAVFIMFFLCNGCILEIIQKKEIPYSQRDVSTIHDSYQKSKTNMFLLLVIVALDIYKLKYY